MSFIPDEELRGSKSQSLAPMIDFLFLMLMFFATLAVSRVTTRETEIDLVEVKPETTEFAADAAEQYKIINVNITADGTYTWTTELRDYPMATAEAILGELQQQYQRGLLPEDKQMTQVLLKIDRKAQWDPILRAIFAVREAGFVAHPVYLPEESTE